MSSEISESEALSTLLLVAGASALKHVVSAWIASHSDVLGEPEKVGTVSELWLYPVKSATGISVDSATCTRQGFCQFDVADRSWIVMTKTGRPFTQGTSTKMATVKTSLENGMLCLDAPNMPTLRLPTESGMDLSKVTPVGIPGDKYYRTTAADCGDKAGAWFDKCFGKEGLRLKFSAKNMPKMETASVPRDWVHYPKPGDQCAFANYGSYMLIGKKSVELLNTKMASQCWNQNFRPSIVADQCKPFDEDSWQEVTIGNVKFRKVDTTSRCYMVDINPMEGKNYNGPKKILKTSHYRPMPDINDHRPNMGIYLALDSNAGDVIKVGDQIVVRRSLNFKGVVNKFIN